MEPWALAVPGLAPAVPGLEVEYGRYDEAEYGRHDEFEYERHDEVEYGRHDEEEECGGHDVGM